MPAFRDDVTADIAASIGAVDSRANTSVASRLLAIFTTGEIEPGTRLPPERQLAATLGVGRSAVREALAALEMLGIVTVRMGAGTYLRGRTSELLPQTLSWGLALGARQTEQLIEVRSALEIYAARVAATRMSEAAVARLGEHLDAMRGAEEDLPAFVEADLQFHLELAQGTDNEVLLELLQTIRSLLRVWADRAAQSPAEAREAIEQHAAVAAAIAARDPDAAASTMAAHMHTAARRLAELAG
ncbi:FadR/GntR family transcriptional regulator [Pseudactinotalea terrae]|uniref:FadR/GntR family transcriptional regulator n=1 Tax=Pseudactinotalea terrae TaxID=1743262 RepID=UPI0012E1D6A5|nr:FadR/GntR family transcriptional regulator [Pseudactinotalea terrae]